MCVNRGPGSSRVQAAFQKVCFPFPTTPQATTPHVQKTPPFALCRRQHKINTRHDQNLRGRRHIQQTGSRKQSTIQNIKKKKTEVTPRTKQAPTGIKTTDTAADWIYLNPSSFRSHPPFSTHRQHKRQAVEVVVVGAAAKRSIE